MVKTKYEFDISDKVVDSDINRLTNQLWKLIPMKENNENWLLHLNSLIIEIAGLNKILSPQVDYLILLSKLEGLRDVNIPFFMYRKTVFEAISLLRELRL